MLVKGPRNADTLRYSLCSGVGSANHARFGVHVSVLVVDAGSQSNLCLGVGDRKLQSPVNDLVVNTIRRRASVGSTALADLGNVGVTHRRGPAVDSRPRVLPARVLNGGFHEPILGPAVIIVVTRGAGIIVALSGQLDTLVNRVAGLLGDHEAGVLRGTIRDLITVYLCVNTLDEGL